MSSIRIADKQITNLIHLPPKSLELARDSFAFLFCGQSNLYQLTDKHLYIREFNVFIKNLLEKTSCIAAECQCLFRCVQAERKSVYVFVA